MCWYYEAMRPKNEASFEPEKEGNHFAIDLLEQVTKMNNGLYLDEDIKNGGKTSFCAGVAGYPEKHFEAPNLEIDLDRLKQKSGCGCRIHYDTNVLRQ